MKDAEVVKTEASFFCAKKKGGDAYDCVKSIIVKLFYNYHMENVKLYYERTKGRCTMSEKLDKLRADLARARERRIQLNNRIELLERRIAEAEKVEVAEMVRVANLTPEQLAALLQQNANTTPNPAALEAVGANTNEEELREKISE